MWSFSYFWLKPEDKNSCNRNFPEDYCFFLISFVSASWPQSLLSTKNPNHLCSCSGQKMTTPQDHDMCPAAPDYLKWTPNSRYQLLHIKPWGERASCLVLSSHSTPRKGPRVLSGPYFPDIHNYQTTTRLYSNIGSSQRLRTDQQQSFSIREGNYDAVIPPYSKYSPISVEAVIDSSRYLGMPMSIIKHCNLSS